MTESEENLYNIAMTVVGFVILEVTAATESEAIEKAAAECREGQYPGMSIILPNSSDADLGLETLRKKADEYGGPIYPGMLLLNGERVVSSACGLIMHGEVRTASGVVDNPKIDLSDESTRILASARLRVLMGFGDVRLPASPASGSADEQLVQAAYKDAVRNWGSESDQADRFRRQYGMTVEGVYGNIAEVDPARTP